MKPSELFYECISTKYTTLGASADYAIRRNGNELFFYFEASDGRSDWLINLNFLPKAYSYPGEARKYAHRGFLGVWEKLKPTVEAAINNRSIHKVTVVGYSHGAAIALLCHEYVWFSRPELRCRLQGFGFGCPRVLCAPIPADTEKRFESFTVIRNIDDIVTHLPPAFFGFVHTGKLLEIGTRGKYGRFQAHYADNILSELITYENSRESAENRAGIHIKIR